MTTPREVLAWHYECVGPPGGPLRVRYKAERELGRAGERLESPYDTEARYCSRQGTAWVGYRVHVSETCDQEMPRLLTHVETTPAQVHEQTQVAVVHEALSKKGLLPEEHLVDSAYASGRNVVESRRDHGVTLVGPAMLNASWQSRKGEAFGSDAFKVDWERRQARCPQGKTSTVWSEYEERGQGPFVRVRFSDAECQACPVRGLCTSAKKHGRQLSLRSREEYEAIRAARERLANRAGQQLYALRSGIEGTISQGVRAFEMRQARYRGMAKAHLQHLAIAAAMNLDRLIAWIEGRPRASTRTSRFAALAA